MAPKVSVIIPAYNCVRYIGQAISSVLAQDLKDLEVIVVDDGSTDGTKDAVHSLVRRDGRVRLLINETNCGPSHARNRAIDAAQGEWLAVLDADDWFVRSDRLSTLVRVGEERGADLVADDLLLVEDGQDWAWGSYYSLRGLTLSEPSTIDIRLFLRNDVWPLKPCFRRAFLTEKRIKYNEDLWFAEDWDIVFHSLLAGGMYFLVPLAGYVYRMRPRSLSSNTARGMEQALASLSGWLSHPLVAADPVVEKLLRRRPRSTSFNLRYYRVVEPLLRGEYTSALGGLARDPLAALLVISRLPKVLGSRLFLRKRRVIPLGSGERP